MRLSGQHLRISSIAASLSLLLITNSHANASTITTAPKPTAPSISNAVATATCEFRTINYITDTLPQQCLKSSWSSANGTAVKAAVEGGEATTTLAGGEAQGSGNANGTATAVGGDIVTSLTSGQEPPQSSSRGEPTQGGEAAAASPNSASESLDATATDLETGELSESSFLSFEEWKKQTLEKAGQQANGHIGSKKSSEGGSKKRGDSESFQNNLDSLGEEGEIDLDFAAFRSGGKEEKGKDSGEEERQAEGQDLLEGDGGGRKEQYRSKDAGKTCKERANYASFDAGATILKTHHGAKNNKAVLIENKDSYMLSECTIENKFVIIELSEDIWIDTVVLANYEFFSSMIRTFRVSVSDRYPVKLDKWKDIGTYEARNSREIQAFLITNPQIWTRYIRIEFLSHYGNEYYCPLSLVRVHGTRMLESWKESEANGEDDDVEEIDAGPDEQFIPDAVAEVVQIAEMLKAAGDEMARTVEASEASESLHNSTRVESTKSTERIPVETTPWEQSGAYIFRLVSAAPEEICLPSEAPVQEIVQIVSVYTADSSTMAVQSASRSTIASSDAPAAAIKSSTTQTTDSISSQVSASKDSLAGTHSNTTISSPDTLNLPPTASTTHKVHNSTHPRNKTTSTTSASSSLPTIQESFFKAVSRRLNFLETNSTLSLKYIEEQSRILREAFTKVEKKQLQKTTTFLDTLNNTVLDELRQFRQQYDEIWQSTVISLESQRDESRREILAISSRLNILADEVVFQKRMSIVQSVLLLLCLALVIFSRVSGGNIDFPTLHSRARNSSGFPLESPLESPGETMAYRTANGRLWPEPGHRGLQSDEDDGDAEAPPTPLSAYEDVNFTPPSGADEYKATSNGDLIPSADDQGDFESGPSSRNVTPVKSVPPNSTYSSPQSTHLEPTTPKTRTPKKRKGFIQQRSASVEDEVFSSSPIEIGLVPKLSTNDMTPPVPAISVQDATPVRRQRPNSPSASPSPFPTPGKGEKSGVRVTTREVSDSIDGDEDGDTDGGIGENSMMVRENSSSHLPSPPPEYFHQQEETIQRQQQRPQQSRATSTIATATARAQASPPSASSSPIHERKQSFSIARKPLPALPPDA